MAITFDSKLGKHVRIDGGPGSGRKGHKSGGKETAGHTTHGFETLAQVKARIAKRNAEEHKAGLEHEAKLKRQVGINKMVNAERAGSH